MGNLRGFLDVNPQADKKCQHVFFFRTFVVGGLPSHDGQDHFDPWKPFCQKGVVNWRAEMRDDFWRCIFGRVLWATCLEMPNMLQCTMNSIHNNGDCQHWTSSPNSIGNPWQLAEIFHQLQDLWPPWFLNWQIPPIIMEVTKWFRHIVVTFQNRYFLLPWVWEEG